MPHHARSRLMDHSNDFPNISIAEISKELPERYHQDILIGMVRDPWWTYAYWEVSDKTSRSVFQQHESELHDSQIVLRVYDESGVDEKGFPQVFLDVPVGAFVGHWYLHLNAPGKRFFLELGHLTRTGKFISMIGPSNRFSLPRENLSDMVDAAWVDFHEVFQNIYGQEKIESFAFSSDRMHQLSFELRTLVLRRAHEDRASESFSPAPH